MNILKIFYQICLCLKDITKIIRLLCVKKYQEGKFIPPRLLKILIICHH